jgi:hypothetical protein
VTMRPANTRRALFGVACAFVVVSAPAPAAASCIGPSVSLERPPVWRGDVVAVRGEGWGDGSCYDTGAPPAGQGALGKPAREIELAFEQGERRIVVARGGADASYRFTARIVVPPELEAGPAVLAASTATSNGTTVVWFAVMVESERAVPAADVVVATFGPAAATASSIARTTDRTKAGGVGWFLGALLAALVSGVALLLFVSHQRRTSASERPDGLGPAD